jgi:hypothetical protein
MVQYSSNFDKVSSKSQTSKGNVLRTAVITLFAAFVMPIILAPSVNVFAQDENCCKGRSIGYIIDKSGKKVCGQIVLHSSLIGGEVWKDQFVISFSPQEKVDKDWAKAKAREKKGKTVKRKFFLPDISTAKLQGYGYADRKFVTKRMELDSGVKFLALEVLSEEDKTYKFYDPNDNPSDPEKYHIYREKPNGELVRMVKDTRTREMMFLE